MLNRYYKIIERIDHFAEKSGTWLNAKTVKIVGGTFLGFLILFFGFIIFTSKFFRSLFGLKG